MYDQTASVEDLSKNQYTTSKTKKPVISKYGGGGAGGGPADPNNKEDLYYQNPFMPNNI